LKLMKEAGLHAEHVDPGDRDDVIQALAVSRKIRDDFPQLLAAVPEPVRETVAEKTGACLDRLEGAPRRGWNAHRAFLRRYGSAFWRILARKPEGSGN
jgi:hypothetical protein